MKSRPIYCLCAAFLALLVFAAGFTSASAQDDRDLEDADEQFQAGESAEDTTPPSPSRGSAASWSADLPVVSDGRHVWLWAADVDPKNDERRLTALFHADATDRPPDGPVWETVTGFTGRVAPRGAAVDTDTLWLIFDDGRVGRVSLRPAPLEGDWFFRQTTAKSLPASTTVRASVAAHGKLWVLARVETGQAIADLDRADVDTTPSAVTAEDAEVLNLVLGLPRELDIDSDDPLGHGENADPSPAEETADPDGEGEAQDGESAEAADDQGSVEPELEPVKQAEQQVQEAVADTGRDIVAEAPTPSDDNTSTETLATDESAEATAADQVIEDAVEQIEPLPEAPADRLLVLDRGQWRVVPLPEDWDPNRPTQLIAPRDKGQAPTLLVQGAKTADGLTETLYRPVTPTESTSADGSAEEDEAGAFASPAPSWSATPLTLPSTGGVVGLRVKQQLVLVQHTPAADGFAAKLWAVRGDQLTALGDVTLDASTDTPDHGLWAATPMGEDLGLLVGERDTADAIVQRREDPTLLVEPSGPTITALDLHGQTTLAPLRMTFKPRNALAESADLLIFTGVVILSLLLLLSFWRRDPTVNALALPEGVAVADLMRRGLAGAIDLAPGLLVATSAFALPFEDLFQRWPGQGNGASWGDMIPGLVAIGVIVGHTTLLEIATGRSLGKWMTGLRVATLAGERAGSGQIVIRGVLKTFDLIAYPLLILMIISPYRQRLGDMVAQTVVVAKAPIDPDVDRGDDQR
ncbi:MAG: RDD family protein [Planctomycetota bacterium]